MDTVTYPDTDVQQFLRQHFTPLRLMLEQAQENARQYNVLWTPTFLFLDAEGAQQHRALGYLPPKEFRAELGLGLGKAYFGREDWANAIAHLREVASRYPETWAAPEAQYWLGVARYKAEGTPDGLRAEWNSLLDRWPDSRWAHSASFIRS